MRSLPKYAWLPDAIWTTLIIAAGIALLLLLTLCGGCNFGAHSATPWFFPPPPPAEQLIPGELMPTNPPAPLPRPAGLTNRPQAQAIPGGIPSVLMSWSYPASQLSNTTFLVYWRTNATAGAWGYLGATTNLSCTIALTNAERFYTVAASNRVTGLKSWYPL